MSERFLINNKKKADNISDKKLITTAISFLVNPSRHNKPGFKFVAEIFFVQNCTSHEEEQWQNNGLADDFVDKVYP